MAAFDKVSRVKLQTITSEADFFVDVRFTELPFVRPRDIGFDPRDHRHPKAEIKVWMAYFNLIRLSFGAGMMAMPLAISQVGILLGPIMVMGIGLLMIHTHLLLLSCLNEMARQLRIPSVPYRYGFRLALLHGPPCLHCIGNMGPGIVAIFMFLSQLGICTLFVLFTSDNLRDIMDWESSVPALLTLYLPYLFLEISMKNLTIISQVSMGANVMSVLGLLCALYEILIDPHGEVAWLPKGGIPIMFSWGTLLFNQSALGVCLSCEAALSDPRVMTRKYGAIQVGIAIPIVIGIFFGTMGYYSMGVMEENVLRYLPFDSLVSQSCFGLYSIAVGLSYPLMCYPGIQIILAVIKNHDPVVEPNETCLKAVEWFLRPLFVSASFILAWLIPFQGAFVAFVGNLCTTMLALIFPALMEIGIDYPDNYGPYGFRLVKDILIIVLGLTSWVFGISLCGWLIYVRLASKTYSTVIE